MIFFFVVALSWGFLAVYFEVGPIGMHLLWYSIRHIDHRMEHLLSSGRCLLDKFLHKSKKHKYPLSVADTTTATPTIDVTSKWFKSKILNALATHHACAYCNLLEWSCSSYEYIRRERVPNGRADRLTDTNWNFFFASFQVPTSSLSLCFCLPFDVKTLSRRREKKWKKAKHAKKNVHFVVGAGVLIWARQRHGKNSNFHAETRKYPALGIRLSTWFDTR